MTGVESQILRTRMEFKLKFGGEKITYYNIFAGNTVLGKAAVLAMKAMKRVN